MHKIQQLSTHRHDVGWYDDVLQPRAAAVHSTVAVGLQLCVLLGAAHLAQVGAVLRDGGQSRWHRVLCSVRLLSYQADATLVKGTPTAILSKQMKVSTEQMSKCVNKTVDEHESDLTLDLNQVQASIELFRES